MHFFSQLKGPHPLSQKGEKEHWYYILYLGIEASEKSKKTMI